jgi:hypothetical protein
MRRSTENGREHGKPNAEIEDEEVHRLLDALATDGVGLVGEVRRLAVIERERLRLGVERSLGLLALLVAGSVISTVLAIAAGLRALEGLAGALDAAFAPAWAADLAAGVIGLATIALIAWAVWIFRARLRLAGLRQKLKDGGDAA